jgi:hypothetical protein
VCSIQEKSELPSDSKTGLLGDDANELDSESTSLGLHQNELPVGESVESSHLSMIMCVCVKEKKKERMANRGANL